MEGSYDIPYETKKKFSAADLTELTAHFKANDTDKTGKIDKSELKTVLVQLGYRETKEEDVAKLLEGVDLNADNELTFAEFLELVVKLKNESSTEAVTTVTKTGKEVVEKTSGSYKHTYAIEERECFSRVINQSLKDDED